MGVPTVLLLHGQPGSAHDWHGVRRAIGERARAIAPDRPGWNGHGAPRDLAGNADFALSVLDAHGIDRAVVAGHSLGGAIAAWLAAEHPDRVAALVLAAPSANCASLNRLDQLLAAPVVGPLLAAGALATAGAVLSVRSLRRRIAAEVALDEGYLRAVGRVLLVPSSWVAFNAEQRWLLRELPSLELRLGSISSPTTIVSGSADRIVTPSSARRLAAQIGGAEVVQLPGAMHLLPQQRPGELAEIILRAAGSGGASG
ncbi:MAG TPA: alpha/beta hydrolase [Solirubrobacteraceae bacterium]